MIILASARGPFPLSLERRRGNRPCALQHRGSLRNTHPCHGRFFHRRSALDARLPFDEPYCIPERTAAQLAQTKLRDRGRIIAIGTSVVRALEAAANADGSVRAGKGIATGRIEPGTPLRVVDAVLTGIHQPGESHFELLRAFADDALLADASAACFAYGYRAHEFGDSMLLYRNQIWNAGRDFCDRWRDDSGIAGPEIGALATSARHSGGLSRDHTQNRPSRLV